MQTKIVQLFGQGLKLFKEMFNIVNTERRLLNFYKNLFYKSLPRTQMIIAYLKIKVSKICKGIKIKRES